MEEAFRKKNPSSIQTYDYYKYKVTYIVDYDHELMFLFVTDLTDKFSSVREELVKCKKDFLNLFDDILKNEYNVETFDIFDATTNIIHHSLKPKISLVGFSGVGKTTISKLIKAEEIPVEHIPTITGDITTFKIGNLHFHLWDFAGQEEFSYIWNRFVQGSDAVLLITDSTLENVDKSEFFIELIKDEAPNAHVAVIGNKQDLPDAMKPEKIEDYLGFKTYSMVAKDPDNRDKMIQIIADILEMSAEVSPLLRPLLERDKHIEKAMEALENNNFDEAIILFQKISDLCIELGDDSLGREFYEKTEKIKKILKGEEIVEKAPKISLKVQLPQPRPRKEVEVSPVTDLQPSSPSQEIQVPEEEDEDLKIFESLITDKEEKSETRIFGLQTELEKPSILKKIDALGWAEIPQYKIKEEGAKTLRTIRKGAYSTLIDAMQFHKEKLESRKDLENSLQALKIKKSKIDDLSLELDTKKDLGELTADETEEKKTKLKQLEVKIEKQIKKIQDLLTNPELEQAWKLIKENPFQENKNLS